MLSKCSSFFQHYTPKRPSLVFSSKYWIVHCKMACTVVDIWSLWITHRDVPDLLLWETSALWENDTLLLDLQQDEMEFLHNMSMLQTCANFCSYFDPPILKEGVVLENHIWNVLLSLPPGINCKTAFVFYRHRGKCRLWFSEDSLCMLKCQKVHTDLSPNLKDVSEYISSNQPCKAS